MYVAELAVLTGYRCMYYIIGRCSKEALALAVLQHFTVFYVIFTRLYLAINPLTVAGAIFIYTYTDQSKLFSKSEILLYTGINGWEHCQYVSVR